MSQLHLKCNSVIPPPPCSYTANIPLSRLRNFGFTNYLKDTFTCPPLVMSFLCSSCSVCTVTRFYIYTHTPISFHPSNTPTYLYPPSNNTPLDPLSTPPPIHFTPYPLHPISTPPPIYLSHIHPYFLTSQHIPYYSPYSILHHPTLPLIYSTPLYSPLLPLLHPTPPLIYSSPPYSPLLPLLHPTPPLIYSTPPYSTLLPPYQGSPDSIGKQHCRA